MGNIIDPTQYSNLPPQTNDFITQEKVTDLINLDLINTNLETQITGTLGIGNGGTGVALTSAIFRSDGSIIPASLADAAATNNSIYYSTTLSKLVYKDSGGTVNALY